MKNITQKQSQPKGIVTGKQYSYPEIVDYLDAHWDPGYKDTSLASFKKVDQALGTLTQKLPTIIITGTNGKSLTTHFASRLLKEEGLHVGALMAPHILTYNERIVAHNETISNKLFTDVANEVLAAAAAVGVEPYSLDLITLMALLYFWQQKADVLLLEQSDFQDADPISLCKPKMVALTRVTNYDQTEKGNVLLEKSVRQMLAVAQPETHIISADQSKLNLQLIQRLTLERKAIWAMPIRKLAPLPYPFEQLHGRSAALAERIAQIYVNTFLFKDTVIVANSLLIKQKGQRGRPTIEAKRNAEINPRKTIEQFWKEVISSLPGRFQLLDKEKPTILLDNAANLDAFQNLLLGIRLLHYHRPLKGLTLILGNDNPSLQLVEFLKQLRYFFKKTSGSMVICTPEIIPSNGPSTPWDAEQIGNEIKNMKIKCKTAKTFKEAFEFAQRSVDERHGLIVIAGSNTIVTEYWRYKGMKKLQ